jgi:TetR/AcrR family transcriptional regulator of autoinduction and epiphytic fitness
VASPGAHALDGRQRRRARSRRAICEACLDLVQEGVLQPSAEQVADRAGLSRRSIFNHFQDLAELYDAVVEVGLQRCAPLLEEVPEAGAVARRVEELVRVRSRFLEATAAFTRALTAQALVGPAADQAIRVSREALRLQQREVERVFGQELRGRPAGERAEVLETLSAALSPLQWEYLRRSRGHSIERARAVLARTLRAILADAAS